MDKNKKGKGKKGKGKGKKDHGGHTNRESGLELITQKSVTWLGRFFVFF